MSVFERIEIFLSGVPSGDRAESMLDIENESWGVVFFFGGSVLERSRILRSGVASKERADSILDIENES